MSRPDRSRSTGISAFRHPWRKVTLREVRDSDAPALLAMLTSEEVAEFVSPLPRTVEGFRDSLPRRITSACAATASASASCRTATKTRWGCFRCGSSSPGSAAPSGASRSARRSGERGVSRGREGRHRFLVRRRRRASSRGAVDRVERPRQRGAAQGGRVAGRRPAPLVPAQRHVTSIRFSGRFSRMTGARRRRMGARLH